MRFFHAHEEDEAMAQAHYANPAIQKAFTILKTLSADEETRLRVEVRERALKDAISELAAAKDEGRAVGRQEGELIGEIRATQRFLRRSIMSAEELAEKTYEELAMLLQQLQAELNEQRRFRIVEKEKI